jgi:hypothetical protein
MEASHSARPLSTVRQKKQTRGGDLVQLGKTPVTFSCLQTNDKRATDGGSDGDGIRRIFRHR